MCTFNVFFVAYTFSSTRLFVVAETSNCNRLWDVFNVYRQRMIRRKKKIKKTNKHYRYLFLRIETKFYSIAKSTPPWISVFLFPPFFSPSHKTDQTLMLDILHRGTPTIHFQNRVAVRDNIITNTIIIRFKFVHCAYVKTQF